jgi:hypothetical protein
MRIPKFSTTSPSLRLPCQLRLRLFLPSSLILYAILPLTPLNLIALLALLPSQFPILPPLLLIRALFLLTLLPLLDLRPRPLTQLQLLDLLLQDLARHLAIYRPRPRVLVLDDDARGDVLELHGGRCLVNFLAAGPAAVQEVLDQVRVEQDASGREGFLEDEGRGAECAAGDMVGGRAEGREWQTRKE